MFPPPQHQTTRCTRTTYTSEHMETNGYHRCSRRTCEMTAETEIRTSYVVGEITTARVPPYFSCMVLHLPGEGTETGQMKNTETERATAQKTERGRRATITVHMCRIELSIGCFQCRCKNGDRHFRPGAQKPDDGIHLTSTQPHGGGRGYACWCDRLRTQDKRGRHDVTFEKVRRAELLMHRVSTRTTPPISGDHRLAQTLHGMTVAYRKIGIGNERRRLIRPSWMHLLEYVYVCIGMDVPAPTATARSSTTKIR